MTTNNATVEGQELTETEIKAMIEQAREMGRDAGRAAASWVFDGNTSDETYRRVLEGIEDGDPEIMDSFRYPNLSGEFAGDPTPQSLADDVDLDAESDGAVDVIDALCAAYEEGVDETFIQEIERTARFHVAKDKEQGDAIL